MPLQIKRHKKQTLDQAGFNMLMFGNPGSGKTTLCATFPDVLYVDTEGGTKFIDTEMDVVQIHTWEDVKEVITVMDDGEYKTVVFDVVDEVYELYLDFLRKTQPSIFTRQGQPTMQGWGVLKQGWRKFCKLITRNPNYNSVFVAHVKEVRDSEGRTEQLIPKMIGSMSGELVGFVDFVGFKEDKYSLEFRETALLQCTKDRHGKFIELDSPIYNPNFEMLRDLVNGTYPPIAAILPARFKSKDEAYHWAGVLGYSKEETDDIMANKIKSAKKAVELRKLLHEVALKQG